MVEKLRTEFEKKHSIELASVKGVSELACKIGISVNTIRRFSGKIKSESKLSAVSLNMIAKFLDYENYKEFTEFESKNNTIDFLTLRLLFDSIKNEGIVISDLQYKHVNRQFAEKILLNTYNLNKFLKTFSNDYKALVFILAWHPLYSKVCDFEYQKMLLNYFKKSNISHVKVFSNSFVFFGQFISNSITYENYNLINTAEKEVKKMRKDYDFYFAFPEMRFAIAKTLYLYHIKSTELDEFISTTITYFENNAIEIHDKTIFSIYYSNALNLIKKYEGALNLQVKHIDLAYLSSKDYYHSYSQLEFYKISNAITLYNIGEIEKAKSIYIELKSCNLQNLPFDIKDYVEIQFYLLGYYINNKDKFYLKKIEEVISETNFQYFKLFL